MHGTLVSYLHSGWQSESMRKISATESDRGASGSALRDSDGADDQLSRSCEPEPAGNLGSTGQQQSRVITERQPQECSTTLELTDSQQPAYGAELNNAMNLEEKFGSSTGTSSRREEAMALLEGRHQNASLG